LYMFCCMRVSVSGLMALLVLWFFPLNIFIQEQADDILVPPLLRNCLTLMTFPCPSHYLPPRTVVLAIVFTVYDDDDDDACAPRSYGGILRPPCRRLVVYFILFECN